MKYPVPPCLVAVWLTFVAINALQAQQGSLQSKPGARDIAPPVATAQPLPPPPSPLPPEIKLVRQFDQNGDQRLDEAERKLARDFLIQHPPAAAAPGHPGQPIPQPLGLEPIRPGPKLAPTAITSFPGPTLYDQQVVPTLFLDFADNDWEGELADFAGTDVVLPARLTVDGHTLKEVGVHARALPPAAIMPRGYKRPLDLALDYTEANQQLGGQRQLQLLASASDPTFLRSILYSRVAREYLPTPRTGFVRLVINGESWGIYITTEPLDANFLRDNFRTRQGAIWSVTAGGNLSYLGDKPEPYRANYHLQTAEDPTAWAKLAELCRLIAQTKPGELETALAPHLDLDQALRFFALENVLINQDGYGSPNGGFGLVLDDTGRFHLVPTDAEASFRLVQITEYGKASRNARQDRPAPKPNNKQTAPPEAKALQVVADRENFPHQSNTNLAMLLSYSFVNKADGDFDGKVSRAEWAAFARAWFIAMDEDQAGRLTRDQFIAKIRLLVTPQSITDGRSHQTFGKEDAAALIGGNLFDAMHGDHDGPLTREEFTGTFDRWFTAWSDPKTKSLTQESLQTAFGTLFTKSVFAADQTYIAIRDRSKPEDEERGDAGGGHGGRGHGGGAGSGGGNSGLSVGPLHVGGFGGQGRATSTLVTFSEELDPLAGLNDATKPLLARLLAAPELRGRYLNYVRDISASWLTWAKLGPIAKEYHALIATDVSKDGHKTSSYEKFVQELDQDTTGGARDGDAAPSLRNFIEERGAYLGKDELVNSRSAGW